MLAVLALVIASVTPGVGADNVDTLSFDLEYGDSGLMVAELNRQLNAAGFNADDADVFDYETRHAVYAFQKHHELTTDGVFTAAMWELLAQPIDLPQQRNANRIEVDIGKQVLYVLKNHKVVYIAPISSGNGELYTSSRGTRAYAMTPEGEYTIERNINGTRRSFLGTLYDPYYFVGGFAFHGSGSVPNYPASHGCVRLTMWDSAELKAYFFIGQPVYVYGGRTPVLEAYTPPPSASELEEATSQWPRARLLIPQGL
jgi:peptidoglycan hydrolase-like protein with peptidoglycan-binding domain